jgi:hypothetical protein
MTPFEILNEIKRRSAQAVVAQSGIAEEGLRRYLRALLEGQLAREGAPVHWVPPPRPSGSHATVSLIALSLPRALSSAMADGTILVPGQQVDAVFALTAFATQHFSMPSIRAGATNCRSTFRPRMKPLSPSC